jgi:phosphopentomutase
MPRILVFVMDSAGVGALPDAVAYHDAPSANTIGNVAQRMGGLRLPNFERLGLGHITAVRGLSPADLPAAAVARLKERSKGKDTITGHWEMVGVITEVPFPTYPDGFPPEVVERFTAIAGKPPLGNKTASGTEIIAELGEEHMRTGRPILYTSADSVFQVAAHEEVVPLATLYGWCERARAMLVPPHEVNRVIARPFVGSAGNFSRTPNRRDYAIPPPPTVLDRLERSGVPVHAVGKICDIYSGHGIASSIRVADNGEAVDRALALADATDHGLVFVNLNDFDTKYGHRRDVRGYGEALARLDARLPELFARVRPGDALIFTADHGCDPTQPGSDHTREYVPYLEHTGGAGRELGVIEGLGYVGERIEAILGTAAR